MKKHWILKSLAGSSLLVIATAASAQDSPAPASQAKPSNQDASADIPVAGDIVVTARRREESLQDVPQTVNVVTAAQIEKLNLRDFSDIQTVVPGLTLSGGGSFSTSATVRGVDFHPEASGNNPSVEFYLNDAPIASNFLFQSLFDIGQFELLRGPQGTLRGRASPSGSITVTSRKPDLKQVGFVGEGTITNQHDYKGDFAFNIPVIRDVLAVRIAGVVDENRGNDVFSIKAATDPTHNLDPYRHTQALRASVRLEPTDSLDFNFMYETLSQQSLQYAQVQSASQVNGSAPSGQIIGAFDRLSFDDVGANNRQQFQIYDWGADFRFLGQKLSYVGTYNTQNLEIMGPQDTGDYYNSSRFAVKSRQLADPAGYEAVCAHNQLDSGIPADNEVYYQCTHSIAKRSSDELRLASEERIAGIFDYVVGAFYDYNRNPSHLTQETPLLLPANFGGGIASYNLTPIVKDGYSVEKSVFGNLTAHLGSKIELSGGLRYIDYHTFNTISVSGNKPAPDTYDKYNATIFTGSAKYNFSADFMVYAQVGSSWRPGIRTIGDFSLQQSALEQSFLNLPPESSKSYEVGFKSSFLDRRAHLNVSVYHQDFTNYPYRGNQVYYVNYTQLAPGIIAPSVGNFNFVAAVPVKVDGVEAEASFQISPRWSVGGNFSYANGRITNGVIACNDLDSNGIPDSSPSAPTPAALLAVVGANHISQCKYSGRATFTPKWGANLQSEYNLAISHAADGFLRGLATYVPSNTQDPNNVYDDTRSYLLANLFAGVRDPKGAWEISFFAKNILGTQRILNRGASPLATGITTLVFSNTGSVIGANASTYTSSYFSVNTLPPRELGISLRIAIGSR